LTYAAARGHALIDGTLYLPKSWTDDPPRRVRAGVPDDIEFATPKTPSGHGHSGDENTKPPPATTTINAGQNTNEPDLQL